MLDENNLHINVEMQEVCKEELIKTFEILHNKGLINKSELQRAIMLANEKYKSIKFIENKINIF